MFMKIYNQVNLYSESNFIFQKQTLFTFFSQSFFILHVKLGTHECILFFFFFG